MGLWDGIPGEKDVGLSTKRTDRQAGRQAGYDTFKVDKIGVFGHCSKEKVFSRDGASCL